MRDEDGGRKSLDGHVVGLVGATYPPAALLVLDALGDTSDFSLGHLTDRVSNTLAQISDLCDGVRLARGNGLVRGVIP